MQRVRIQSSRTPDTQRFAIKITVTANVVDPRPGAHGMRGFRRDRKGNGASSTLPDPPPQQPRHVAANQRADNPTHDPSEGLVALCDGRERSAERKPHEKVREDIERGPG